MNPRFRSARPADAAALADLDAVCNPSPWSASAFASHLEGALARATVSEVQERVVAFCAWRLVADELEILQLGTDPRFRRRGLARDLVKSVLGGGREGGARSAWLDVRASNVAARALYASLGFRAVGRRPAFYRDPEDDALVLQRVFGDLEMAGRPVLASQRIDGLTSECGPREVEMTSQELLENDEYRRLADEHHQYDARLQVLTDKIVLSDEEQLEESTLKKKKLQLKDRMESLAREMRARTH